MNALAEAVARSRAEREIARRTFDTRYNAMKADMEERGIAGRIADETLEQAKDVFDEAVAVVQEHPGAVGGTLAALVLWFLRNPLISWLEQSFGQVPQFLKEMEGDPD